MPRCPPRAFYAGLRLVAIDGSSFELPDEADNAAHFGYPGSRTGHAGYPQARCMVVVECATHAILGANLGPFRSGEWELFQPLLPRLKPGMLCLADRGFNGFEHWQQAQATGAQLLWRCVGNRQLPVHRMLEDDSYLSAIHPIRLGRKKAAARAMVVRVVEYALPGLDDAQPRYRLLTTLLDPQVAPALELAALYHQRWEIEAVFDELKTHLRQSRRVLRSKTAELVRQEFYGWVLAHYSCAGFCIRVPRGTDYRMPSCPSLGMYTCFAAHSPSPGHFPPARPRRRRRWFNELLEACARIRATRTLNKRSPRMVKRRHSPYATHDRRAPTRVPTDCTPKIIGPPAPRPKPADAHISRRFRSFIP